MEQAALGKEKAMDNQYAWLDRIIAEQAKYYGQTVKQFKQSAEIACELQKMADFNQWETKS